MSFTGNHLQAKQITVEITSFPEVNKNMDIQLFTVEMTVSTYIFLHYLKTKALGGIRQISITCNMANRCILQKVI